jgi:hypothetical protein
MKTGTTYLQSLWRANREQLAEQGVLFPAGPGVPVQRFAVWDLLGRRPRGASDDRTTGQWAALQEYVAADPRPTALISEEALAPVSLRKARRVVESFPDHEVHVVITARDLGRVLASAWQEAVKSGSSTTWPDFVAAVRDPDRRAEDPARSFWRQHDLAAVADTWAAAAGTDRVHVVTLPPAGAPPSGLLDRMGELVGFDPARLDVAAPRSNESLTAPTAEVLRRLNARWAPALNQRQYDHLVKQTLLPGLPPPARDQRLVPSAEQVAWIAEDARRIVDHLTRAGYDVVGATDDLVPTEPGQGRHPDAFTDTELADAATDALEVLGNHVATTWWRRRKRDRAQSGASAADRAGSAVRGAGYRAMRRGSELADSNRLARWGMRVYLESRERARRRALRRG